MFFWELGLPRQAVILLSVAIILLSGFLMTRITKLLHLPNVSGYIIAGILIGPGVLNLVPEEIVGGMDFVNDIALSFIAFGVGKFFKREVLARAGGRVVIITLMESLLSGAAVTAVMVLVFHLELPFSLLLGAIATATAPASTMMTIDQYHARGPFVDLLLQVVAFDDVVCLLVFSVASTVVSSQGAIRTSDILQPILRNLGTMLLGAAFAWILSRLLAHRSQDNRLILAIAMLLGLSGICTALEVSPLLSCMVFGAFYINLTHDKILYHQINAFKPPILSLFFVVSGMNLDVAALSAFGSIGLVYFLVRIVGKYLGAFGGCALTGMDKNSRNWLGLALVPQAGVAIGLAHLGRRILPEEYGGLLMTIILASSVLYELIGPACAKLALFRSGVIQKKAPLEAPPTQEYTQKAG